ncbi:MAG: glycerol kinase GlpK [Planctomycetota bacterium]|jgi:glycerol kinase|nr:glycerol kinase GlpK [Planctomycetota bacterium]
MPKFILSIDQSTSGTKAILFDDAGGVFARHDLPHRQLVDDRGWVEHDPDEIFHNLLGAVSGVLARSGIDPADVAGAAISNQRETAIAWDRRSGEPVHNAIVWQCARGEAICRRISNEGCAEAIRRSTGIPLSPYHSAAKLAWILENVGKAKSLAAAGGLCCSTMDAWLVFKLCGGTPQTEYANASRTQLFNISTLEWDAEACGWFGLDPSWLPEVGDSNRLFGYTDFGGLLPEPAPLHAVLGDSHGALYGQGCTAPGSIKATYGTGSSVMMNIGNKPLFSDRGVVTSLAWGIDGRVDYVFEGNLNYTGAVIRWLVEDIKLIADPREAEALARNARDVPGLYLVPAFSGLGAPYWDSGARGIVCGLSRAVGKAELVRAAEECIAYQITDLVKIMERDAGFGVGALRVDGGATRDDFLMQFQSDLLDAVVEVPAFEELSASGPAYLAGLALGIYAKSGLKRSVKTGYEPRMSSKERERRYGGWLGAIGKVLINGGKANGQP